MSITISSANNISSLFSSFTSSQSSSSSSVGTGLLSQYSSIRNGSYYKLLKAYYANEDASSNSTSGVNTTTSADTAKMSRISSASLALKDDAMDLASNGKDSVFQKVDVKAEDGTTSKQYDTDAIYKKISSFVDNYNSMISQVDGTKNASIYNSTVNMIRSTSVNQNLLSDIGISIDSDTHQLSIDEEKFKAADMSTVKSLFQGNGSYAYQIATKAFSVNNYASNAITQAKMYNSNGGYSASDLTGMLYQSET